MIRVLFVDDDRNVLDGLRRNLFRYRGEFDMTFESDPERALQLVADTRLEAVVSDFRMPGVDGAQLLLALRASQPACARLILSGHVHEADMVRAATVAHQFLSKPCDIATLVEALQRATRVANLLAWDDVREEIGALQLLPSSSAVVSELQHALDSNTSDTREIAALASRTPSLAAKMLQLVNSSFFGQRELVDDVTRAASLLGTDVIRSLVLMSALVTGVDYIGGSQWLSHVDEIAHARACAARTLAPAYDVNPELAFSGALLQEVGQIAMINVAPRRPTAADHPEWIVEADAALTGLDHARIGAFLLTLWALPLTIVEAVGGHTGTPTSPLSECMLHAHALVDERLGRACTASHDVTVPAVGSHLADLVARWQADTAAGLA